MTQRHGTSYYERMDACLREKQQLAALIPENVRTQTLAGESIIAKPPMRPPMGPHRRT